MTPIVLYSELLSDNDTVMQEMPEEVYELNMSAKRCEELAKQLLDYSRQGRAERVLSEYNATFAVESSISIVSRLIPEKIKFEDICMQYILLYKRSGGSAESDYTESGNECYPCDRR